MAKRQLVEKNFQKGAISIVLAVLVLSIISTIVIGIATLTIQQTRLAGQTGQSVIALYAADAGAERCLYEVRKEMGIGCDVAGGGTVADSLDFNARAKYTADYNGSDTITSKGEYMSISRKIELNW
ncbi:pilus assembly PilX N-terminal domain-containing protein [Patescibacteria group bacterium]|nr:pilus assembly PilX N-terminal domain-containing protein [Patescibacteria group bacterium]MCG2809226.1 pilus assembly PilX N-terminal domain-containing protein [Candidatus Portnoybacteria bacterium]